MNIKKIHKITSSLDFNFFLLGISSAENDFKFCWIINQALEVEFKRENDLTLFNERLKSEQKFSLYSFITEENKIFIISNKTSNGVFIEEHKTIDFFIKFECQNSVCFDEFQSKLKQINEIQAVFKIDVNTLKSKHQLIFEV